MGRNGNDVFVLGEESLAADDALPTQEGLEDFAVNRTDQSDAALFASRSPAPPPSKSGPRFAARRLAVFGIGAAVAASAVVLFHGVEDGGGRDSVAASPSPAHAPAAVAQTSPLEPFSPRVSHRPHPAHRKPVHLKPKKSKLKNRPRGGPEREPNSEPAPVGPPVDAPAPASVPLPVTEPAPSSPPSDPSPPPTGGGGSVARPEFGFER
jgi:hypothetical protein